MQKEIERKAEARNPRMNAEGNYDHFSWPGMYSVRYVCADGDYLCADCANAEKEQTIDPDNDQWYIVNSCVILEYESEDDVLYCSHCQKMLEAENGIIEEEN